MDGQGFELRLRFSASFQTGFEAYTASRAMGYWGFLPRRYSGRDIALTTYLV
jgi:hypothetical protein